MERGWEEVGPTAESGGGVPEGLEPPARFLCAASSAASMLGGRGHRLSLSLAFSQPPLPLRACGQASLSLPLCVPRCWRAWGEEKRGGGEEVEYGREW
eukprot:scaffold154624_cov33-Tisochrysis_lutea.AAC.4